MSVGAPRIALVGFGGWGPNLARVLAKLGHLCAIYESAPDAQTRARASHPDVPCRADWHPGNAQLDAVVLATPAATHAALAQAAMHAGLDVFVEKPLAMHAADALATQAVAERTGRIVMVGHLLLHHPAVGAIAEAVQRKQLGPLRQLIAERHNFGVIRTSEDVIFSLGPHDVAAMLHIVGAMPTHVAAQGQRLLGEPRLDACQIALTFTPTLTGRISLSWLHPVKAQRLIVQGAQAALVFDDVAKHMHLQPMAIARGAQGQPEAIRAPHTLVAYKQDEPLTCELEAFIEAVRTRQQPVANGEHGVNVVRVLAAAQASVAQGGTRIEPRGL